MPAVGCDVWLAKLGLQSDGGTADEEDSGNDSGAEAPEFPRCIGFPMKRLFSDDLAFGSELADEGVDAAIQLETDCATVLPQASEDVDFYPKVLHVCEEAEVHVEAEEGAQSDSSGGEVDDSEAVPRAAPAPPAPAFGGGEAAQSTGWVVKKRGVGATAYHFVRRGAYEQGAQMLLLERMQTRPTFLNHIDAVFGNVLLESSQVSAMQQESLRVLFAEFDGKLWRRPVGDIPRTVHRDPPPEVYSSLTWEVYLGQYRIFRKWVYNFLDNPYKGEFFHVEGYHLKKAARDDDFVWYASAGDVVEAGRWQRHIPRPGSVATSRLHGKCVVVDTVTRPNLTRVYKHIMSTPLAEIRCLGIWHVVVSVHRSVHMNRSSEALAETVGGVLANMQGKWRNGRPMNISYVANAAAIRMAGLRGFGGEDGLLATALNMHFGGSSPERWHFQTSDELAIGSGDRRNSIAEEVRRQALPPWILDTVRDLACQRRMRFAVRLPYPTTLSGQRMDDESPQLAVGNLDRRKISATRRVAVADVQHKYEPDCISEELWRQMGMSMLSLPAHLRPGKYGR